MKLFALSPSRRPIFWTHMFPHLSSIKLWPRKFLTIPKNKIRIRSRLNLNRDNFLNLEINSQNGFSTRKQETIARIISFFFREPRKNSNFIFNAKKKFAQILATSWLTTMTRPFVRVTVDKSLRGPFERRLRSKIFVMEALWLWGGVHHGGTYLMNMNDL